MKRHLLISIASILTLSAPVYGQNLFEADSGSGTINIFTPGGVQSAFASGLNEPSGLVFNGAGNLFQTDYGSGSIYEYTPGGTKSTFATGLIQIGIGQIGFGTGVSPFKMDRS
jgi:hypothetical protein